MDSITEYVKKLEKFRKELPEALMNEVMETTGADIRAEVSNRVVTTGQKGSGGRFTEYKPRKKKERVKTFTGSVGVDLPGYYAELRRLKGLQTNFKDFSFTGEMWKSFNVLRDQSKLFKNGFRVRMGGTNDRAQDIIDGQSKYEGEAIIDLTDAETEALGKRVDKIVLRLAKEYGL